MRITRSAHRPHVERRAALAPAGLKKTFGAPPHPLYEIAVSMDCARDGLAPCVRSRGRFRNERAALHGLGAAIDCARTVEEQFWKGGAALSSLSADCERDRLALCEIARDSLYARSEEEFPKWRRRVPSSVRAPDEVAMTFPRRVKSSSVRKRIFFLTSAPLTSIYESRCDFLNRKFDKGESIDEERNQKVRCEKEDRHEEGRQEVAAASAGTRIDQRKAPVTGPFLLCGPDYGFFMRPGDRGFFVAAATGGYLFATPRHMRALFQSRRFGSPLYCLVSETRRFDASQ